jgi:hypothetical protein
MFAPSVPTCDRFRAIERALCRELGCDRVDDMPVPEAELVRQGAVLALRTEQLQAAILRGEPVDDDTLIRLSGASRRLLETVESSERGW